MTNILNRVASSLYSRFRPSSPDDYFALRLASGLGEPESARHYAVLASQYSHEKILCAYHHAVEESNHGQAAPRAFHDYLASLSTNGRNGTYSARLLAVHIERRSIAVALFTGIHLEGRRVLQLSSNPQKAEASTAGFIRSVFSEHDCESAGIEAISGDTVRAALHATILAQCRQNGIGVWEVPSKTIVNALAHPPLKSRAEIRQLMLQIWPMPGLKRSEECALEAFALGLYLQTERLFVGDK